MGKIKKIKIKEEGDKPRIVHTVVGKGKGVCFVDKSVQKQKRIK